MAKKKGEEPVVEPERPVEAVLEPPAIWELLPDGRYASTDGGVRDFRLQVAGVTYEHVGETADGRWIYSVVR
jgi:hypothetical protein